MAAPSTIARSAPLGIPLRDGYSTKVAFEQDPDISLWEKTVTPPGLEGGDPIDFTTMHNTTYRTFSPRSLATLTPCTFTCLYDPDAYNEVLNILNVEGSITVHFSDGSTLDFYGYLQTFDPSDVEEGAPPEATCTIQPTNWDNVNDVEASPVLTEVSGT